jgi:hypothetical protein
VTFASLLNPAHPAVAAVRGTFARHWTKPKSGAGGDGLGGGGAKGYGEIMGPPAPLKLSQLDSPMVKLVRTAMCETLSDEDAKGAMQVFLAPNPAALEHQLSLALGDVQFQTGEDGYRTFTLKARKTVSQEYEKYFTNSIVLVAQPRNGGHVTLMEELGFVLLGTATSIYIRGHNSRHFLNIEAYGSNKAAKLYVSGKIAGIPPTVWCLATGKVHTS